MISRSRGLRLCNYTHLGFGDRFERISHPEKPERISRYIFTQNTFRDLCRAKDDQNLILLEATPLPGSQIEGILGPGGLI